MKTYYFDRFSDGKINGLNRNEQYPGQESKPDTDQEIIDWFAAETQEKADREADEIEKAANVETIMPDLAALIARAESATSVTDLKEILKEHAQILYQVATGKLN